jgi:membrane associated rhomboid family serine protease
MLIPFTNSILPLYPAGHSNFIETQYVTSIFAHAGLLHYAFNMLGLYFIIKLIEQYFGFKKIIYYYLLIGIAAGSIYHVGFSPDKVLLGASGALFGLFGLAAFTLPKMKIYLFFIPIPLKLINVFVGYMAIELALYAAFQNTDGIAHLVHVLGGALGYVVYMLNKRSII